MFNCSHPAQEKLQQELYLYIAKQQHSQEIPELAQLLEWAILNCTGTDSWTVDPQYYPQKLCTAIKEQNLIGWQNIFYGRISTEFEAAQEEHYRWLNLPDTRYNGRRWASDLIHQIWKTTLTLWNNRNKAKHDNDEQENAHTTLAQLITNSNRPEPAISQAAS
jgi:hypothetical protein